MRADPIRIVIIGILVFLLVLITIPILMSIFMGWQLPMSGMMDMMGGFPMFIMALPIWALFIILIIFLIGLVQKDGGESREIYTRADVNVEKAGKAPDVTEPDIFRVLKPDERRVVELLMKNGGVMTQKDLRWELGMNRVQIHRVLERLEERNIVSRRSIGNTNEVRLSEWFMEKYVS